MTTPQPSLAPNLISHSLLEVEEGGEGLPKAPQPSTTLPPWFLSRDAKCSAESVDESSSRPHTSLILA